MPRGTAHGIIGDAGGLRAVKPGRVGIEGVDTAGTALGRTVSQRLSSN